VRLEGGSEWQSCRLQSRACLAGDSCWSKRWQALKERGGQEGRNRAHLGRPAAGHSLLSPQDPLHSAQLHSFHLGICQGLQHVTQTEDLLAPTSTCQPRWESRDRASDSATLLQPSLSGALPPQTRQATQRTLPLMLSPNSP
jgi:hypothetical protein